MIEGGFVQLFFFIKKMSVVSILVFVLLVVVIGVDEPIPWGIEVSSWVVRGSGECLQTYRPYSNNNHSYGLVSN